MDAHIILDVATAALPDANDYLDTPKPDARLTDPAKIAASIAHKRQERLDAAGLDLDLCRLTAIGYHITEPVVLLCHDEDEERAALTQLATALRDTHGGLRTAITYNGHSFDLPVLMRRARYLGVLFPTLGIDRYKSLNTDLMLEMSDRDPSKRRALGFYVKRLKMGLTKTLSGEEEAKVHEHGNWEGLRESVLHDLEATRRLALWWGAIRP